MLVVQIVYLHKGTIIWGADWVTVNTSAMWTLKSETSSISWHWLWTLLLCQWTHLCVIEYLISTLEPGPNPPVLAILCFSVSGICCTATCSSTASISSCVRAALCTSVSLRASGYVCVHLPDKILTGDQQVRDRHSNQRFQLSAI